MDLRFSSHRCNDEINSYALQTLKQNTSTWKKSIERFCSKYGLTTLDCLLKGEVIVNGKPMTRYFNSSSLLQLVTTLKTVLPRISEAKSILQDVFGILALVAIMCNSFVMWVKRSDAESLWKDLLKNNRLIIDKASTSYHDHKEIYDQIFNVMCKLIEPEYVFCIRVAATLFARVWSYRHSMAEWIAANWETVAAALLTAAVVVGGALAVYAFPQLFAYGIYKLYSVGGKYRK